MFWLKCLFLVFLINASILPESICLVGSKIEHQGELPEYQHARLKQEASIECPETGSIKPTDEDHFLLPQDLRKNGSQNQEIRWNMTESTEIEPIDEPKAHSLFSRELREDGSQTTEVSVPKSKDNFLTKSLKKVGTFRSITLRQKTMKPDTLLECMLKAVESSLTVAASTEASVVNFVSKVYYGSYVGQPPDEIAPSGVTNYVLNSFIEAATPCFDLFKRDRKGNIRPDQAFGAREEIEAMEVHPNGPLTLAAAQAVIENVSRTYVKKRKPQYQYDVNRDGLGSALGAAIARLTRTGRVADKSAECINWLARRVSQRFGRAKPENQITRGSTPTAPTHHVDIEQQ